MANEYLTAEQAIEKANELLINVSLIKHYSILNMLIV
jgi:hypothetical protein